MKSITIISEYLADLTSTSTLVYRNKEVFFNKAGFLVKLQMSDDFDDIYYKIIGHVGNEIARAIQAVVEGTSPSPTVPSEAT
ncbi:hypothetical protein [Providencia sp. PROV040]|uniref:hypothetical protein n=1 Tax=Providencia sp. PROV040 TaxID=2949771 RepID=UPI00234A6938|nr:hypothetical protein [Providencia sp. PROV040]